jgi:aspartate/tyrosine/aromatic aminotransferase
MIGSVPTEMSRSTFLDDISHFPADPLLLQMQQYAADVRPEKINVGIGIYIDPDGNTPVMSCVKGAEQRIVTEQSTKAYRGAAGDEEFNALLTALLFGDRIPIEKVTAIQTVGGTGALRLAFEFFAKLEQPRPIMIGSPSWPNHWPIIEGAALPYRAFPCFDFGKQQVNFQSILDACLAATAGQSLLLQPCCHNPTGADLTKNQWRLLIETMADRGIIPLFDLAYHGLADGIEQDSFAIRLAVEKLPEFVVAYSCDKNFGLYRERTGALFIYSSNSRSSPNIMRQLLGLVRSHWSMPPDHGAAVVRTILKNDDLRATWNSELDIQRIHIHDIRRLIASANPALSSVGQQKGLFSMLNLDTGQTKKLRDKHGIYVSDSGRFNVTGLSSATIDRFVNALTDVGFSSVG